MLSKQQLGLPKNIKISNESYDGDVTFAATESVDIRHTEINGNCQIMTGVAPDEIEHVKENGAKIGQIIQDNVLPLFGSSVKIMMQFGDHTLVETITPDSKGLITLESGSTCRELYIQKSSLSVSAEAEDIESVTNDISKLHILSFKKM